jgi:DNA-binding MarR family transcriptional regulator
VSATVSEDVIKAWARLMRAQQMLLERVEGDLKRAGLPPLGWYDVLLELSRRDAGRLRQFELGDKVLLSKHNLSRLLDRLENEQLISRQPCEEDRRGAHVVITRQGRALLKKMWPVYENAIGEHFGRLLSGQDAAALANLMQRFTEKPA